jgi:peptidoglycan/xylan/chitin deacetylase (PgdA/CDA1 family)
MKHNLNIPILTYHSLDENKSVISTAPDVFRRQMNRMSEMGLRGISLQTLSESLIANHAVPKGSVVLTFDDGFENFYTTAFPVLEQYGFKATVFLVTEFCGKNNDWENNPSKIPPSKLMSWSQVKELDSRGIEFGSHTKTHPDLTRITEAVAEREIVESQAEIEDALGRPVTAFAYPYGKFNNSVRQIAAQRFSSACSTNLGKAGADSDLFSLERIDAYYLSRPLVFDSLSSSMFDRYMQFRQAMRSIRATISRN